LGLHYATVDNVTRKDAKKKIEQTDDSKTPSDAVDFFENYDDIASIEQKMNVAYNVGVPADKLYKILCLRQISPNVREDVYEDVVSVKTVNYYGNRTFIGSDFALKNNADIKDPLVEFDPLSDVSSYIFRLAYGTLYRLVRDCILLSDDRQKYESVMSTLSTALTSDVKWYALFEKIDCKRLSDRSKQKIATETKTNAEALLSTLKLATHLLMFVLYGLKYEEYRKSHYDVAVRMLLDAKIGIFSESTMKNIHYVRSSTADVQFRLLKIKVIERFREKRDPLEDFLTYCLSLRGYSISKNVILIENSEFTENSYNVLRKKTDASFEAYENSNISYFETLERNDDAIICHDLTNRTVKITNATEFINYDYKLQYSGKSSQNSYATMLNERIINWLTSLNEQIINLIKLTDGFAMSEHDSKILDISKRSDDSSSIMNNILRYIYDNPDKIYRYIQIGGEGVHSKADAMLIKTHIHHENTMFDEPRTPNTTVFIYEIIANYVSYLRKYSEYQTRKISILVQIQHLFSKTSVAVDQFLAFTGRVDLTVQQKTLWQFIFKNAGSYAINERKETQAYTHVFDCFKILIELYVDKISRESLAPTVSVAGTHATMGKSREMISEYKHFFKYVFFVFKTHNALDAASLLDIYKFDTKMKNIA
jgi:hypothetical protein